MDVNSLSDEFCADVLFTAAAGGISYWCEVTAHTMTADSGYSRIEILEMPELDQSPAHHTVTCDTIRKGCKIMMETLPEDGDKSGSSLSVANFWQLRAWLEMSIQDGNAIMVDADVADTIVQLGLFEETVYA